MIGKDAEQQIIFLKVNFKLIVISFGKVSPIGYHPKGWSGFITIWPVIALHDERSTKRSKRSEAR